MADKIKTLSAAIRYGSTFIGESMQFFYNYDGHHFTCGCAIGTAYLAVIEPNCSRYESPDQLFMPLHERFNVPLKVLHKVSRDHYNGRKTRAQCADWLEARGY